MSFFQNPTLISAPARGPLSALWRIDARHHALVDLSQGLCRYRLRGIMFPGRS